MRCTCEQAVIEALEEVARWCEKEIEVTKDAQRAPDDPWFTGRVNALERARELIRERIAVHRAKAED